MITTVRSEQDERAAEQAGAHEVVRTDGLSADETVERISTLAPDGVHHVVEVAFDANIAVDEDVLAMGGSIATYATGDPSPSIPFWPLVFKNVRVFFLGSDDFPDEAKRVAAAGLNEALDGEWPGFQVAERFSLGSVVEAHESLEAGIGRVVVMV